MFDFIVTAVFVITALLLLVMTVRDWRATKRTAYILPTIAFVLAGILFIDDPVMMGMPWQAGINCLLIGLVLHVAVRRSLRRQT
jgi:hypothetical protein